MSTTRKDPPANPGDRTLVITRVFDAPRHLVFEAWTKKEHLDQWCAPRGFTIPFSEGDARPGGTWRSCMRAPNGEEYRLGGVYREIIKDELVVFTQAWDDAEGKPGHETVVTIRFFDEGQKTRVVFEQAVFATVESRDSHQGGWTECFDRLAELLANLRAGSEA